MASPTKYLVLLRVAFCVIALFFMISGTESRLLPDASMRQRYQEWAIRYGKQYSTQEESESRYRNFAENVNRIDAFNAAGDKSYTLGVNQFADLSEDELKTTHRGYKSTKGLGSSSSSGFQYEDVSVSDLPSSLDWRDKGAVTPVKSQATCGSCWAFSAVAALEGITKLRTGALVSLSEQELVDCDHDGVYGCRGGWMDPAFQYVQKAGLSTEKNYPYRATDNNCTAKYFQRKATISGYEDVPANNETSLLKAVAHQPVSVAINSTTFEFSFYEGGIFTGGGCSCSPTALDHAVTVVGYGETDPSISFLDDGKKYWIIKNSWGKGWGEEGYIRFARDVDQPEGLCGIATTASYPTKHWGRF